MDAAVSGEPKSRKEHETIVYRAGFNLSEEQLKTGTNLAVAWTSDPAIVYLNGEQVGRIEQVGDALRTDVAGKLRSGANVIAVVIENTGHGAEPPRGVELDPTNEPKGQGGDLQWELSGEPAGVAGRWWDSQVDDSKWKPSESVTVGKGLLNWYRMKFELPEPGCARVGAVGD